MAIEYNVLYALLMSFSYSLRLHQVFSPPLQSVFWAMPHVSSSSLCNTVVFFIIFRDLSIPCSLLLFLVYLFFQTLASKQWLFSVELARQTNGLHPK